MSNKLSSLAPQDRLIALTGKSQSQTLYPGMRVQYELSPSSAGGRKCQSRAGSTRTRQTLSEGLNKVRSASAPTITMRVQIPEEVGEEDRDPSTISALNPLARAEMSLLLPSTRNRHRTMIPSRVPTSRDLGRKPMLIMQDENLGKNVSLSSEMPICAALSHADRTNSESK